MRVLVAEDDRALAAFLRKSLEGEGHTVHCIADGAAVTESILQDAPDLLLLDLGLPVMEGVEVLRAVQGLAPGMAIIVLTGRSQLASKIGCLNLGADDYLVKPFSMQELLARCRAVRRRRSETNGATLHHGDVLMNRISREVTVAGRHIEFTAKEFTLLEYLLLQRGRAVSRQELLREVWRMSPDAGTNVVDVYVNYLRRKLGCETSGGLIETIRGEGYAIGAKPVPPKLAIPLIDPPAFSQMVLA